MAEKITIDEGLKNYNSKILTPNNPEVTVEVLDEAFDEIQDSIAVDAYSTVNGNFVSISDDIQNLWTDNKLKFTKNEATGTYLIEQLDENGNWISMGYTTEEAVQDYLKKVNSLVLDDTIGGDDSLSFREVKEQQLEDRHSKEGSNKAVGDDSLSFREVKEQQLEDRHSKEYVSLGERTTDIIQDKYNTAKASQLNSFDERDSGGGRNPLTQALNDTKNGNIDISQYNLKPDNINTSQYNTF